MYVSVWKREHVYVCGSVFKRLCVFWRVHMFVGERFWVYVSVFVRVCVSMCVCVCVIICVCKYVCVYVCKYVCVCVCLSERVCI